MLDIVSAGGGLDIGLYDTQTVRAANILSVQVGALEYSPLLGIDLAYFLSPDFKFQNASFKSYLVEVLANNSINVASLTEAIDNLFSIYGFNLSADQKSGFIAR